MERLLVKMKQRTIPSGKTALTETAVTANDVYDANECNRAIASSFVESEPALYILKKCGNAL
jgi:hypothetical protein